MTTPSSPKSIVLSTSEEDIDAVVMDCIVTLLRKEPFYGSCLSGMNRTYDDSMKAPAAVTIRNATPLLFINPKKFIDYNPFQRRAIMKHEVLHLLLLHMHRRIGRNFKRFNIAADMAINPMIRDIPVNCVFPKSANLPDGMNAEFYYDNLVNTEQGRQLLENLEDWEVIDSHDEWEDVDDENISDSVVRSMTNEALQRGTAPGELGSIIPQILKERRVAWNVLLRSFVATLGKVNRSSSWKKENKRVAGFPGYRRLPGLNLLVVTDTSGSVSDEDLAVFFDEIDNIFRDKRNVITVMESDAAVGNVYKYTGVKPKKISGRGGTTFAPALKAAWDMNPRPDGIVYFTDGWGENPSKVNNIPVIWIVSKNGSTSHCARFGRIVQIGK